MEAVSADPFSRLESYSALPRVEALALSPDGRRVVLTVAGLSRGGEARAVTRLAGEHVHGKPWQRPPLLG